MFDKNGRKILLGDIVRVTGSCVAHYNSLYYVEDAGSTDDESIILKKLNQNGTVSKSKYGTAFFPLICFMSNRKKSEEIDEYNRKYAKIEVVNDIPNRYVIDLFSKEAHSNREAEKYYMMRDMNGHAEPYRRAAIRLEKAINRMRKEA